MQENSHNPPDRGPEGQHQTRQLLLLLAYEYGVFLLASYCFAHGAISGQWTGLWGGVLLFLASPLSIYVIGFAVRCRREKTANRYLALVVILFSSVLVVPFTSIPVARYVSPSFEGMARKYREVRRVTRRKAFEGKQEEHYSGAVQLFSRPVAMEEAWGPWVLFDNGLVGELVDARFHPDMRPRWIHHYLSGKPLRAEVVDQRLFLQKYIPGPQMFRASRRRSYGDVPIRLYADGEPVNEVIREAYQEYEARRHAFRSQYGHRIESFMRKEMYGEAEPVILAGIEYLESGPLDSAVPMIALLKDLLDVHVSLEKHHLLEETMHRRESLASEVYGAASNRSLRVLYEHLEIYEEIGRSDRVAALAQRRKAIFERRRGVHDSWTLPYGPDPIADASGSGGLR